MGASDRLRAPLSTRWVYKPSFAAGQRFHLPHFSTLNTYKPYKAPRPGRNHERKETVMPHAEDPRSGHPTGFYLSPVAREEERQAEALRQQYRRDKERKEAALRGPSRVLRAYAGLDYIGRPYDDVGKTGAWIERPELGRRRR